MKTINACLLLLFASSPVFAQEADSGIVSPLRSWKSANGLSLGGALLFFDSQKVVVKPEDRDPVSLKLEQLSLEDQGYLEKWRSERMTQWAHETDAASDPRFSGALVIIPKHDRPVRVDSKGTLLEPFVVCFGVLEKNPSILRDAPKWSLLQTVQAQWTDGRVGKVGISTLSAPLDWSKGEAELVPLAMGMSLSTGKTSLTLKISGTGKTVSNSISVKVQVE